MLDPNVKQNLLKAVDLATNPGACQYMIDDKPACVVAQYMALNGVSAETLVQFEGMYAGVIPRTMLHGPARALLIDLQHEWDSGSADTLDETRTKMRALIEEADRA